MRFLIVLLSLLVCSSIAEDEEPEEPAQKDTVSCYVCGDEDVACLSLESFTERTTFLQECPDGCAVRITEYGHMEPPYDVKFKYARGCRNLPSCDNKHTFCCFCDFDGCNIHNHCAGASTLITTFVPKIIIVGLLARQHIKFNFR